MVAWRFVKRWRLRAKKFLPFLLLCTGLFSQVSMLNVLKRAVAAVVLEEDKGNQVMFLQIDNVKEGYVSSQTYSLKAYQDYTIYAIGDSDRIADIDMEVFDDNGNSVGEDDDASNVAIVNLTPKWAASFKIKVKPYQMKSGAADGFYGIIVVRRD